MAEVHLSDCPDQLKDNNRIPYILQLGNDSIDLIRATWFNLFLTDAVAELFAKANPGKWREMAFSHMQEKGVEEAAILPGWEALLQHKEFFRHSNVHYAIIALCSHWDWFLRKLSAFIIEYIGKTEGHINSELRNIEKKPIINQISIIQNSLKIEFPITDDEKNILNRLFKTRNIGIHNRWEVDSNYVRWISDGWQIGEFRIIRYEELRKYGDLVIKCIKVITEGTAEGMKILPREKFLL